MTKGATSGAEREIESYSEDEARAVIEATSAETGLPADDPVRFGADRLWPAVRDAVEALPWV